MIASGRIQPDATGRLGSEWFGWILLGGLVLGAFLLGVIFPLAAWLWMWMLAGALWLGFKGMAVLEGGSWCKTHPIFLFWVGTDALPFRRDAAPLKAKPIPLAPPVGFVLLGLSLLTAVLPRLHHPIAIGWLGVFTMLCLLHFGAFAFVAVGFRKLGFAVEPIMRAPWMARTLGEFWGPRWNRAFSDWARVRVFRPLVRRLGTTPGTIAGFFASGLAHELVVSIPAQAGYGLPTLYFLIEAGGLLLQRKVPFLRNRAVTLSFVLLPAPLLFHTAFVERVFAPMIAVVISN